MKNKRHFVIDFDSTFTQVEALDVLGEISLANHPEKEKRLQKLVELTNRGMAGELSFRESLEQRLALLDAEEKHLEPLVNNLKSKVSTSFIRNREFFSENHEKIYIISNGFREFIVPIVEEFGIKDENVFANSFEYDENGKVIGFDREN